MPKFFVENEDIIANEVTIRKDYNHIKNVLRKKVGDKLQICNKQTLQNFMCEISNITSKEVKCNITKILDKNTESDLKITVVQGLPKQEKMELIIQKCVELGAYEFIPLEMRNCVVKLNQKDKQKKIERWQKIAEVASKQSGRNIIPKVNEIWNINQLCNRIDSYDCVIVAYENEENYTIKEEIKKLKNLNKISKIAIVIGPEGGIDEEEIEKLKKAKAKIVTLGKRILRTETVAIALTSILIYELEDLARRDL